MSEEASEELSGETCPRDDDSFATDTIDETATSGYTSFVDVKVENAKELSNRCNSNDNVTGVLLSKSYKKKRNKNKAITKGNADVSLPRENPIWVINPPVDRTEAISTEHYVHLLQKSPGTHPRARFLCTVCQYYCDSWGVVEQHIKSIRHLSVMEEIADEKSIDLLPKPSKEQMTCITQTIQKAVNQRKIDKLNTRQSIFLNLQEIVETKFAGCKVELFGSSVYNVGLPWSDVNLNIVVPKIEDGPNVLLNLFEVLKKESNYSGVELTVHCDIPSIKLIHNDSKLKCSFCLNNTNASQMSQLINKYINLDPRVQELASAFRVWAYFCRLDSVEVGTLPAYAFTILVINYLQQMNCPILPVLHELPGICAEELTVPDKLDTEEILKKWQTSNEMTLGDLWLGLFKFYIQFDANELVVSIKSSAPVKRTSKKWSGSRLAIEDPISNRNVSKTMVNGKTHAYFMACLRSTYLYFATLQMVEGPIFRRVQQLPPGIVNMENLLSEREAFLNFICERHPCFLTEEEVKLRSKRVQLLKPSDVHYYSIQHFIVTPDQAALLFRKFNIKYMVYEFSEYRFTGGKNCPVVCILCREEGHRKDECPEEVLPPLEELPALSESFLKKLSELCESIYEQWSLTNEEIEVRRNIVLKIKDFLQDHFDDVSLKLFGSSCNGFGLKGSDVDICLTFTNNPTCVDLDPKELVQKLNNILKKYPPVNNLVPIPTAKVPILKFTHRETKLEGDISFYNVLALENTRLLFTYSIIDRRVKVLGYVVKYFTKVCDVCDASRGSLSSYAYVLMLIYFLQQCDPPVLPVLQEIKRPQDILPYMVDERDVYFYDDLEHLPQDWEHYGKNTKSVGELWIEFLCFYTEMFDFQKDVICIRQEKKLTKFEKMWTAKLMAIEDPFDHDHNLATGLGRKMHTYIIKAFRKGRGHFTNKNNMPDIDDLVKAAEIFFNDPKFHGLPPDRGCHICKKIGHLWKDCPNKPKNKKSVLKDTANDQNLHVDAEKDKGGKMKSEYRNNHNAQPPKRSFGPVVGKEKNTEPSWRRPPNTQVQTLIVEPSHPNKPTSLQGHNFPVEYKRQVEELSRQWYAGPEYKKESPLASIPGRKLNVQSPQVQKSELVDVFTQPSQTEIQTIEFYNKSTGYSPQP